MSIIFSYFLIFTLPLIHSSLLNHFGFSINSIVYGNFEFSKVIFFDIISSIILLSFLIEKFLKKESIIIYYKKAIILAIIILILSTTFSFSPFISLFGNDIKGHSLIMFLNLIGLIIFFGNQNKKELDGLLYTFIVSLLLCILIGVKEYYLGGVLYDISLKKLIGTFGSNHYLAISILTVFPIIIEKFFGFRTLIISLFFLFSLVLTKSFIPIGILLSYLTFYFFGRKIGTYFTIIFFLLSAIGLYNFFPDKLHSFLSRFYIWENTLKLVFLDIKNILIGNGIETLDLVFNKEKNPYLYIFENYGYTADRSHNLLIDFFYNFGILGFIGYIYIIFKTLRGIKVNYGKQSVLLFLIACFFSFPSITNYLFIAIILSIYFNKKDEFNVKINYIIISIFGLFYLLSIFFTSSFFISEIFYKKGKIDQSITIYKNPKHLIENGDFELGLDYYKEAPEIYYKSLIKKFNKIEKNCDLLTKNYNIVENYFYCGKIYEKLGKNKLSVDYYNQGLLLLPDLWNSGSLYYNNIIIKDTITLNRFYSEKYSETKKILEKTGKLPISK